MTDINMSDSVDFVDNKMFNYMNERFKIFKKENKVEPKIIYLNPSLKTRKYVSLDRFKDMLKRYNSYKKKEKQEPNIIYINHPDKLKPMDTSNFLIAFEEATNTKITKWQDVCNAIANRKYLYYYNDVYSQKVALNRLANKQGLNCTDISQLGRAAFEILEYECSYVHVMCKQGGHIRLRIRGKEIGTDWLQIDLAASLSNGTDCQKVWCETTGKILTYDKRDRWLMIDDGKM